MMSCDRRWAIGSSLDILDGLLGDRSRLLERFAFAACGPGDLSETVEFVGAVSSVTLIVSVPKPIDTSLLAQQG